MTVQYVRRFFPELAMTGRERVIDTPFGAPSGPYIIGMLEGVEVSHRPSQSARASSDLLCLLVVRVLASTRLWPCAQPQRSQLPRQHLWHEGTRVISSPINANELFSFLCRIAARR